MNLLTKFMKIGQLNHVFQANNYFQTYPRYLWDQSSDQISWTINVVSRVLTRKNDPSPGGHAFQPTGIIFELFQDIIGMNLLTKFYEDQTINAASRVKNALPFGSHVFQVNVSIFELIQDIIGTNFLRKFHEDRKINVASRKTAPPPGSHVFSPIWTIFELVRDINENNVLTTFHDDCAKIVISRVFKRNTVTPPGGNLHEDWASNVTSTVFELSRGINGKNVLTNFHEDRTINVASRAFTRQNVGAARRTTDKRQSQKLTMSTLCSGELKTHFH
ncbi:hypothetical protein DPMN_011755 [Dreissena polymorpha]|uniref:Uncharacterized protein n=1 Tax=Dreissena polymorpha TaxID=45954 RepID=A0A9D4N499_DREPO|nr:hypothetical protein DPMN_011755 [Dreissena polymorpha]